MAGFVEAVRRANAPKPPESSVRLRLAAAAAVAVGLLAAAAQHEVSEPAALVSIVLVCAGMAFSHRTRERTFNLVKVGVAVAAIGAMAWFVHGIYGGPVGDITTVEDPLTILFAWILVVHSFHVPARRDLIFALAGSAALMAVAAAQAVDMVFGWYALAWVGCALWALIETGASTAGGMRPGSRMVAGSAGAVVVVGLLVWLVLPAPTASVRLDFRSAAGAAGAIPQSGVTGALAGDSGSAVQLSHPGKVTGPTRVGGYLGFAGDLDTAVRGKLGDQVVMEVRAAVPTFWVGETFDQWTGQSWTSTITRSTTMTGGSPYSLPLQPGSDLRLGADDLQTFYVKDATANLIFHADNAQQLWFPAPKVYVGRDGSIVSPVGIGKGAIYSVDSNVYDPSPQELRAAPAADGPAAYLQLPKAYDDVRALARSVTAGDTNRYDAIQSLIAWIGANTRYSTDIPPLPAQADAVEEFLFGNRTGYCEQISTALTVMLRTLGIPAREAVGYVPGPYNPVTDVYQVRADDAHAWVQAYFSGYGWVSFDPTAVVPSANPSPGGTALRIAGRFLAHLPWAPLGVAAGGVAVVVAGMLVLGRRRAVRRLSPAERAVRRMERAGRRAGRPRRPAETVVEYGAALESRWADVARAVEASAYGGVELPEGEWDRLVRAAQRVEQ